MGAGGDQHGMVGANDDVIGKVKAKPAGAGAAAGSIFTFPLAKKSLPPGPKLCGGPGCLSLSAPGQGEDGAAQAHHCDSFQIHGCTDGCENQHAESSKCDEIYTRAHG